MLDFGTFTRRFARPLIWWYLGGALMVAAVNLISLRIPQIAKDIINHVVEGQGIAEVRGRALIIVGLGSAMILIRSLSRILIFWPGRRLEADAKGMLFRRTLRLTEDFFARHALGDIISRFSNDMGQLRAFYAFGVLQVVNAALLFAFVVAQMAITHPGLTAASLAPLCLMFLITRVSMPWIQAASRVSQEALGRLTNRVTEAFVNVHTVQTNAVIDPVVARIETENAAVYRTNMRLVLIRNAVFPLTTGLAGLAQLVVLLYGGHLILSGRLTVGDLLAFNVYLGLLMFPLTALGIILSLYQRAKTALERLSEIDDAPVEGPRPPLSPSASPTATTEGAARSWAASTGVILAVRGLSHTYPGAEGADGFRLAPVSFELGPRTRLGITGPIGTGKTTLLNLITRLTEPPPGTVLLDGRDVRELDPGQLRRQIGYALQIAHLYSATVAENLGFGLEPEPDQDRMAAAARDAAILEEIERLPQGFATPVGERGVRLSGGQRQRLALARLFLRHPRILLLDDALSAVDQTTEQRLLDHIFGLDCAVVIVSHRRAALDRCDRVLTMALPPATGQTLPAPSPA